MVEGGRKRMGCVKEDFRKRGLSKRMHRVLQFKEKEVFIYYGI